MNDGLFFFMDLGHGFWCLLPFFFILVVKVIGKLQDGTLFLKKGHDDEGGLFEFKTDEGNLNCLYVSSQSPLIYVYAN